MVLVSTIFPGKPSYGACQLGDKTVLDVVEVVRAVTSESVKAAAMLSDLRNAMWRSWDACGTARQAGGARSFGDKSIGRDDPGRVVFQRIVEALSG